MRKTRVLGFALTLAATMVVGSAMGQDVKGGTNYVELKNNQAGGAQGTVTDTKSYIQINKDFGFYALPSAGFHPGYVTPGWVLTKDFKWDWVVTGPAGATATPSTNTSNGAGNSANYTVIKVTTVGDYDVTVTETAPAAFGGCTSTPSKFSIVAFNAPSFTLGTSPTTVQCGTNTATVDFPATILSSGTPHVKYRFEKWSVTVDPALGTKAPNALIGTAIANVDEQFTTATWDVNPTVAATATSGKASITVGAALDLTNHVLASYDFKYTAAIGDLAAPTAAEGSIIVYRLYIEGVNGSISRKADYTQATGAANPFTYYPTTTPTGYYDVYVAAAPVTGPVYHINNNVAK